MNDEGGPGSRRYYFINEPMILICFCWIYLNAVAVSLAIDITTTCCLKRWLQSLLFNSILNAKALLHIRGRKNITQIQEMARIYVAEGYVFNLQRH